MDDLEQYRSSNCLVLHKSDIANNENYNEFLKAINKSDIANNENYNEFLKAINILNIKLKLPSTDVIQKQDIDIVHFLSASNRSRQDRAGTKFTPIIIKFVCCSVQNYMYIYSSTSKLVDSGLFITELLKRKELHFLKVGQQEFQVQNIWYLKGSIFVHIKGEKMIKTMVTKDDNNKFFPYYF